MKNVQVIDGARNCVYDVFATSDDDHSLLFPDGTDIAFAEDFESHVDIDQGGARTRASLAEPRSEGPSDGNSWRSVLPIDGEARVLPSRKDEEAANPDGTRLRR
jgi:hypothetical protein